MQYHLCWSDIATGNRRSQTFHSMGPLRKTSLCSAAAVKQHTVKHTHDPVLFCFLKKKKTSSFTPHDVNLNDLTASSRGDLFNFQFAAILPEDAFILINPADFSETTLRPEQTPVGRKSISKHRQMRQHQGSRVSLCCEAQQPVLGRFLVELLH